MFTVRDRAAIRKLDNKSLLTATEDLAKNEREITERLLWHLKEIERRRLYIDYPGVTSLHGYCTKVLKYSEGSASRRVNACRLLADMPELSEKIVEGTVNLSNLNMLGSYIRAEEKRTNIKMLPEQKRDLAKKIESQTQDNAEFALAKALPDAKVVSEIRRILADGDTDVAFRATADFIAKYARFGELEAHRNLKGFFEVFNFLLCEHLKWRDPLLRKPKASKRAEDQSVEPDNRNSAGSPGAALHRDQPIALPGVKSQEDRSTATPSADRWQVAQRRTYISTEVDRQLHVRAGSQCEWVNPVTGERCPRRHHVQKDHIIPLARGGTNDIRNLQLLCRVHNLKKGTSLPSNPGPKFVRAREVAYESVRRAPVRRA